MLKQMLKGAAALLVAVSLTACSGHDMKKSEARKAPVAAAAVELYEVHEDGRIYLFDRKDTYEEFLSVGETPYRLTRIGAGPKGQTIVFGLHKSDKKKKSGIPHVELTDGNVNANGPFYGEMRSEGRIYVFSAYQDMVDVRTVGEAPYRFTQIGEGPKGETVVFVLNKGNKKKRPDALIATFKKRNM